MNTMVDLTFMMSEKPAKENWIQIMKTGLFKHPGLGELKITEADLHQFKENFDSRVRGTDLAVDVSHEPDKGAVAWFKELKVDGNKLMALVSWTEEGAQLIQSGKYKYFSPEFKFQYTDAESGKKYKDVLFGGAITNRPFLKNMEPIQFSEDESYATVWMADDEKKYDPDNDGDDDSTTDPKENPDWMLDVLAGITKWPSDEGQVAKLTKVGATKQAADAAYQMRQKQLGAKGHKSDNPSTKMFEDEAAKKAQEERAKKYGIKPHDGGSVTKPAQFSDVPDGEFADPVNYAYPIDKSHVMAAYRYFAKPSNQSKYSPDEVKKVAQRIVMALPEDNRDDARKTFKLDDGVDLGSQLSDPGEHKSNKSKGGNPMPEEKTISLAEFEAAQKKIQLLEEQTRTASLKEKVKGFMFNEQTQKGKILPAQEDKVLDLMKSMDDDQVEKFSELLNEMPDVIEFNDEKGHGMTGGKVKDRDTLVFEKADVLMSEGKAHNLRDALAMAEKEIPANE